MVGPRARHISFVQLWMANTARMPLPHTHLLERSQADRNAGVACTPCTRPRHGSSTEHRHPCVTGKCAWAPAAKATVPYHNRLPGSGCIFRVHRCALSLRSATSCTALNQGIRCALEVLQLRSPVLSAKWLFLLPEPGSHCTFSARTARAAKNRQKLSMRHETMLWSHNKLKRSLDAA